MAQAGDEWELSKENVQPLRQGRAMSTLQEVLSQQESSNHHSIQQQKQTFELELRFYNGDDPLDVWDRYIKWAEQAYPQGGKESNLSPLLERAVRMFHQEKRYYDDLRYLNIAIKFANCCTEPVDLYSYLHSQGIGLLHAQLYIAWAEEYEAKGNFKKADSILQDGIQRRAEPLDKLEASHKQFQARVSRQVFQSLADGEDEESESSELQRSSLVDLKARGKNKARAPVSRVGDAIKRKSCFRNLFLLNRSPALQTSRARFAVFDENSSIPAPQSQPILSAEPWATLPQSRAKENEQKAGQWNSGRPRSTPQTSSHDPTPSLPSFTPYVDELAEHQTVTPCKINPSVTSVLSARKHSKEEDPLQRLQSSTQGKEEKVMYCKNKVYAGMEEFSIEEIRAEMYMAKVRKKREEDLLASALRRQEMERQIEELEKRLKGPCTENQEEVSVEEAPTEGSSRVSGTVESEPQSGPATVSSACTPSDKDDVDPEQRSLPAFLFPSIDVSPLNQNEPKSTDLLPTLTSDVPFTIFDETCETQPSLASPNLNRMPSTARRPLAAVSKAFVHDEVPLTDTLDGIEPLNEEAIVSGSDRNKTLFAEPDDTCDFVRAAQLASTPFHKAKDESEDSDTSGLGRFPLREKTPVHEDYFQQVACPKKLSPILEASREDTPSSVSSVSTGCTSLLTFKTLLVQEKTDHTGQMSGVYEQALDCSVDLEELHRSLLLPISELLTSEHIHQEASPMPPIKGQEEMHLGGETYQLRSDISLGESSNLFIATLPDLEMESVKYVAIKVDSQPVPWDFYITQQLTERLGEAFGNYFLEQNNCYLFQDGCLTIYKDASHVTIQDILEDRETLTEEVIILLTYNLLSLVEKLHSVEIIYGDLRTETLLLDNKMFDLSSCTEMYGCIKPTDFSHCMDMRLCPTLTSRSLPIAQTEYGKQVLAGRTSPYQVDLLGIANVVHLMIFSECLQVHQEDSVWKITKDIPGLWRGTLWNAFFSKILNTESESPAYVLKELKDEMEQLLDSFQDELCNYFIQLETNLSPL
ncbi:PREDICTED: mitotic checkpoint serine/threonine-protein kinase BUB1 beta [Nanorana parkeri]|uniref:mitotic checkpoint serine/threonine-protein kinase BUB1 beta n=1 Tax=Nanorana parkeri TaxID=125878 RepID=UPI000854183E|nr:PREDICTED: mitotic checkpoint serine/threonine-protein kinase BUB1 beta [Nanorana parkeri]